MPYPTFAFMAICRVHVSASVSARIRGFPFTSPLASRKRSHFAMSRAVELMEPAGAIVSRELIPRTFCSGSSFVPVSLCQV